MVHYQDAIDAAAVADWTAANAAKIAAHAAMSVALWDAAFSAVDALPIDADDDAAAIMAAANAAANALNTLIFP